ncbi:anti-sigma factor [uncultured Ramlibacter sp.]|uniref:anti-sigma factor n=1 Tax=uncultured Ramlibacter sp. TaxID=260755 RepID=UPI00262EFF42|nr:anti-sigma factor [uncultured Ramlibacter sp.]
MNYSDPHLVDRLASAYVLGTLSGAARRRFERLQRDRADVQLAVTRWESRLGSLSVHVPPVRPSPRVWAAIAACTTPAAATAHAAPAGWLRPAGFGLGALAAGVLAASALFMAVPTLFLSADQAAMRSGERLPQSYVGLLSDAQGNGKLLVSSLRHGRTMTVKVIGPIAAPPPGQRLVLWALPAEGPPFVLGTAPTAGTAVSQLPASSEQLLSRVSKLAVTLEATDKPATPGPALFTGNCAKLW